jgi:hypothetical protein
VEHDGYLTSDSSLNGIYSGCVQRYYRTGREHAYYFKVKPYSSAGGWRIQHDHVGDHATRPISSVGTVIDNSAVVVSWNGTFELVDLEWDLDVRLVGGSLADRL